MDSTAIRYASIARQFARELVSRPTWAASHLRGWFDERFLIGRHQRWAAERARTVSLGEAQRRLGLDAPKQPDPAAANSRTGGGAVRNSAIPASADASTTLAGLLSRLVEERGFVRVVEVGVGRGATTAAMLRAMDRAGAGHLWSIELPSLRRRWIDEVGSLVPAELRERWTLMLGPSRRELPKLLDRLDDVDLFVHDGVHAFHSQYGDCRTAFAHLSPGGVMIVDDVNNDGFLEAVTGCAGEVFLLDQGKQFPIGIAITRSRSS